MGTGQLSLATVTQSRGWLGEAIVWEGQRSTIPEQCVLHGREQRLPLPVQPVDRPRGGQGRAFSPFNEWASGTTEGSVLPF